MHAQAKAMTNNNAHAAGDDMTSTTQNYTILVIDDDEVDRQHLKRILNKAGYTPLLAASGKEGLELFSEHAVDCVLLDYFIPGTHGINTLDTIRQIDATLPVIMVTGQGDEMIAVDAMKHGAVDYLPKGELNQTLLETIISRAIDNAQMRRSMHYQKFQLENYAHLLTHEIREPLRTIRSHVRVVQSQCADSIGDVGRDHLRRISELVSDLDNLINSASISEEQQENDQVAKPIKLKFILRSAMDALEKELSEKKITIHHDNVPDIFVSPRLNQLFYSLFSLYARHAPEDSLHVKIQKQDKEWLFMLTPHGEDTIDTSAKGNFHQLIKQMEKEHPQDAISLQLCKGLLDAKGGKIWCNATNQLDQVYFCLPQGMVQQPSHRVSPQS